MAPAARLRQNDAAVTSTLTEPYISSGRARGVLLIGFLIVAVDGYDSMMMSFLAPLLTRDLGLSPAAMGRLFAAGYLGAMIGAISAGSLADQLGRKPPLIASVAVAGLATGLCAYNAAHSLIALRFVAGLGLGGALPTAVSLVAEHFSPHRRNRAVTLMYIGYPIGAVVGGAVTAVLLQFGSAAIFSGAATVTLCTLAAALSLPESAGHATTSRSAGASALLLSLREQFADGRLGPALLLWISLFALLMTTYFLVSWAPTILVQSGLSPRKAALGSVLLNLGGVLGALGLTPAINRWQPYLPAATAVAIGALLIAVLGSAGSSVSAAMLTLFLIGCCIIGGQLNFPAMTVQLYPQHVRAAGTGWTMAVGRLGSIVGPMLGGILLGSGLSTNKLLEIASLAPVLTAVGLAMTAWLTRRQ